MSDTTELLARLEHGFLSHSLAIEAVATIRDLQVKLAEAEDLLSGRTFTVDEGQEWKARAEAAEAKLAEARNAALEEAAKWCEMHQTTSVSPMAVPEFCDKGHIHEGTRYAKQLRNLKEPT